MKRFAFVVAAVFGFILLAPVFAAPKLPKNVVLSFDKTSPSKRLQAKAPDWFHWEVVRVSPDKKYVARLVVGDGEVGFVTVYRRLGKRHVFTRRYAASQTFNNVDGCVWVPRYKHRLVVTMGGADYGAGGIALWEGPNRTRFLRRAKDEFEEGFNALGVSRDGRILYYEHFGANSPDPNYKRNKVLKMRLPR